jgi:type I restriction enzyme, S subunit
MIDARGLMLYKPNPNEISNGFMVYALMSERVQKHLIDLAGGSTVGHVRVGDIRTLPIPIPQLEEQNKIVKLLAAHNDRLNEQVILLEKYKSVKTGLMQDLLTGKVSVEQMLEKTLTLVS